MRRELSRSLGRSLGKMAANPFQGPEEHGRRQCAERARTTGNRVTRRVALREPIRSRVVRRGTLQKRLMPRFVVGTRRVLEDGSLAYFRQVRGFFVVALSLRGVWWTQNGKRQFRRRTGGRIEAGHGFHRTLEMPTHVVPRVGVPLGRTSKAETCLILGAFP